MGPKSLSHHGVPQENVFGPILFILFINDLPRDKLAKLFLFEDDRELFRVLFPVVCHQELQSDIDQLIGRSDKWQLKFNTSKCKVRHIGSTNTSSYTMLDNVGHHTQDLGVIFDNNLKFSSHYKSGK